MNDKDILKIKFALATISLLFLVTGSKLLFEQWTSIHWSFWLWIIIIAYYGVYRTLKHINSKNTQIVFNNFKVAGTVTLVFGIVLSTIMLLVKYSHISLMFFGLGLASISINGGLKVITFDFDKNKVNGLIEKQNLKLINVTVDIHSDNNQIELKTLDKGETLFVKKVNYNDKVWTRLVDCFQKIKLRT